MRMNIKQLVYALIAAGVLMAALFSTGYYYFLQTTMLEKMNQESLNRAHGVTKRIDAIYDRIAYRFYEEEPLMYQALEKAQDYFERKGSEASVEALAQELNRARRDVVYSVYVINRDYIIEQSTFKPDIGLDFKFLNQAYQILKEVFSQKRDIDLSAIHYDGVSQEFKRYIVQKARRGDYLIQLGVSPKKEYSLKASITRLQENIPTLVNSYIFQVFPTSTDIINIEMQWNSRAFSMRKQEQILRSRDFETFRELVVPMLDMPMHKATHEILIDYFSSNIIGELRHTQMHLWREGRYIHRIMMPFMTFRNNMDKSANVLIMEFDHTALEDTRRSLQQMMWLFWSFLMLLTGALVWIVRKKILDPLFTMQSKMRQKEPVPFEILPRRRDELGAISRTYNRLLEDLQREIDSNRSLYEEFKIFSGNAIHQIRTPLSVIKIALEMIKTSDEEAKKRIRSSLVSIEHMYDSLSYMVQHDKIEYIKEPLNISELFEQRCGIFRVVAETNDVFLDTYIEPGIMVMMNPYEAEYLIDNNLSNAIKYSEPGQSISLSLREVNEEVQLGFENYGKAIENIETIFQRYTRENSTIEGSGIGLNMVKTICERNDVFIQVDYFNGQNRFFYHIKAM